MTREQRKNIKLLQNIGLIYLSFITSLFLMYWITGNWIASFISLFFLVPEGLVLLTFIVIICCFKAILEIQKYKHLKIPNDII